MRLNANNTGAVKGFNYETNIETPQNTNRFGTIEKNISIDMGSRKTYLRLGYLRESDTFSVEFF